MDPNRYKIIQGCHIFIVEDARGLSHKRWSSGKTGTLVFPEDHFDFYGTNWDGKTTIEKNRSSRHLSHKRGSSGRTTELLLPPLTFQKRALPFGVRRFDQTLYK